MKVKVKLDEKKLNKEINKIVSNNIDNIFPADHEFEISCPLCNKSIVAKQGLNTCEQCNQEFNLDLKV